MSAVYTWTLLSCNVAAVIILSAAVVKLVANLLPRSGYETGGVLVIAAIAATLLLACLVFGWAAAPWQHLGTAAVVTALVVGVAAGALYGSSAYFCHHPVVVFGWGMMASALLAIVAIIGSGITYVI